MEKKCKIFCFGDSITYGVGDNGKGFVHWLNCWYCNDDEYNYYDIYNLGVNANTSELLADRIGNEIYYRLHDDVDLVKNIVIICIGANDVVKGVSLAEFESNIHDIIYKCRDLLGDDCSIAFLGIPFIRDNLVKKYDLSCYQAIIRQICQERNIRYIINPVKEEHLSSDGLHPDSLGHKKMFLALKDYINEVK